jgi:ferric-dicitrate binding protein FerR (iron transport regulator)
MTRIEELKAELSLKHFPRLNAARQITEARNRRRHVAFLVACGFCYVAVTVAVTAWAVKNNPLGMQPTVKASTHIKTVPSLPACTFLNTADPYRAEYNAFPICYRI